MSSESDELFVVAFVTLCLVGVAIFLAIVTIIAVALLTMLFAGLISIYMVKTSSKRLVLDSEPGPALLASLAWAATLSSGCVLGSFPLVIALNEWFGPAYADSIMQKHTAYFEGFPGFLLYLDSWLLSAAYLFFIKATLCIYLANRVSVATRTGREGEWFNIVPPLGGMMIFFVFEKWQLILDVVFHRRPASELFWTF